MPRAWSGDRLRPDERTTELVSKAIFFFLLVLISAGIARADEEAICQDLTELQCIRSEKCKLTGGEGANAKYHCRDSVDSCERRFTQESGTKEACESQPGCTFIPGSCYCPPLALCLCAGGPPRNCKSTKPQEQAGRRSSVAKRPR